MSPEAVPHIVRAEGELEDARLLLENQRLRTGVVCCYQAVFLGAQALIWERRRVVAKTHKGLHNLWAELARDRPELREWTDWLTEAVKLRHSGLYGGEQEAGPLEAQALYDDARRFVSLVRAMLDEAHP